MNTNERKHNGALNINNGDIILDNHIPANIKYQDFHVHLFLIFSGSRVASVIIPICGELFHLSLIVNYNPTCKKHTLNSS